MRTFRAFLIFLTVLLTAWHCAESLWRVFRGESDLGLEASEKALSWGILALILSQL